MSSKDEKTVYVVTSGEYSDYGIRAIFSTREMAEDFVAKVSAAKAQSRATHSYLDDSIIAGADDIAEWTLDELAENSLVTLYEQSIDVETGEATVSHVLTGFRKPGYRGEARVWRGPRRGSHVAKSLSPVSAEHALKLAVEARQAYLRKKTEP